MTTARSARVTTLLEAAITIVAAGGLRGLTHRAIDTGAGVPPGSTSYYFRTRQALLQGLMEYIAEQEQHDIDRAAVSPELAGAPMRTQAADLVAGILAHWVGPMRERTRVRVEMRLVATEQPELREAIDGLRARFVESSRQVLALAGSPATDANTYLVYGLLEGLTYDGVTRPATETPTRQALRQTLETVLRPEREQS
ncbi:TetR family transcriptional regulator [Nonomuraea sp. NBC_01738]|uniref:TetR/AcrR family transcriptional regulator n=1 Tax=Nonomuraea sp. NBC_01738 TaxID=2976003 RepID=UPI002E0FB724|nr:TetR family transcriptional regulator [Nonomuraea sp. NBC_01738]